MLTEKEVSAIQKLISEVKPDRYVLNEAVGDLESTADGAELREKDNPANTSRPHKDGWPMPWSAGLGPIFGAWGHIDSTRATRAENEGLCIMCGTDLGEDYVYANFNGEPNDRKARDRYEKIFLDMPPIATFVHPRCLLQAAAFCPFLTKLDEPGLTKDGTPLTRDDLRKMTDVHANV